jgi:hypothetical protein
MYDWVLTACLPPANRDFFFFFFFFFFCGFSDITGVGGGWHDVVK